jgi:hypothetical protein
MAGMGQGQWKFFLLLLLLSTEKSAVGRWKLV